MIDKNIIRSIKRYDFIPLPNHCFYDKQGRECFGKGSWDYHGADNLENHIKNIKTQPSNWYYRNRELKYTINSHGYRTEEFDSIDWKNSVVIFGCSYVYGLGVDDSHTISYFLQELLGVPVINMAIPGSSIQFALHNSLMLYNKYGPPKMVIYGWTGLMRYLTYYTNNTNSCIKNNDELHDYSAQHFIPFNLVNIELIKNIWKDKCPMYEFSFFVETSKVLKCHSFHKLHIDNSRDLTHLGPRSNKLSAGFIYSKVKSL